VDELDNGLRIRQIVRSDSPLVCAVLVLEAGESSSPLGKEGLAALAGDSLQGGTAFRSGAELAEELERLGSSLGVSVGWDGTTVAFTALAERADRMFDLLAEVSRSPAFPTDEVERVRSQRLATIAQRKMEPDCLADDELHRRIFPGSHPYHRPIGGTEESMSELGAEEVRAFALSHLGSGGGGMAIVGDVSPTEGRRLLERTLGDWKGPTAHLVPPPLVQEPIAPAVIIVDKPGAVQSELRIGHASPARSHASEVPLKVASMVLGGAFTSRLNLCLREEHGFTYGVRSRFSFRRRGGSFAINTAVQTEVTGAALAEAMGVFARFVDQGPTESELEHTREYMAGIFPLKMETTEQLASMVAELLIFDLPDDHHHHYRERIRAVELDAVRAALAAHLHPSKAAVVVAGDASRILAEVEALGLGPVEVVQP
jgi:predicted Zn-dependent peptidase